MFPGYRPRLSEVYFSYSMVSEFTLLQIDLLFKVPPDSENVEMD